jgi:integrase
MAKRRANGEGLLRQRKDGRWEVRVPTARDDETGKMGYKIIYGKTQAEAKEKRDEYLLAVKTGTYVEPKKDMFGEYIEKWLERYVKPGVKESTYSLYYSHVKTHIKPAFEKVELQKLNTNKLQDFYNEKFKTLSGSAVNLLHLLIHRCLEHAVEEREILRNPNNTRIIKRPPVKAKEVQPLSQEELKKFLEVAQDDAFYPLFLLDLHTGLRKGELLALKWKDVDFQSSTIFIERSLGRIKKPGEKGTKVIESTTKTEAGKRTVPIPKEIVEVLEKQQTEQRERLEELGQKVTEENYIFDNGFGKSIEARWFLRRLKIVLEKAELRTDIRVHTLRHTFGTMLAQAGENPRNLQELLGHADIRTTLGTYVYSSLNDKKKAVNRLSKLISKAKK